MILWQPSGPLLLHLFLSFLFSLLTFLTTFRNVYPIAEEVFQLKGHLMLLEKKGMLYRPANHPRLGTYTFTSGVLYQATYRYDEEKQEDRERREREKGEREGRERSEREK